MEKLVFFVQKQMIVEIVLVYNVDNKSEKYFILIRLLKKTDLKDWLKRHDLFLEELPNKWDFYYSINKIFMIVISGKI